MSDIKSPRTLSNGSPPEAPPAMRPAAPALGGRIERRAVPRTRAIGRHSVITRNLQSYASYKSWADKIRSSWEPGEDPRS